MCSTQPMVPVAEAIGPLAPNVRSARLSAATKRENKNFFISSETESVF